MVQSFNIDPGARATVRIAEVAKRAAVSAATVSRVLNDRGKCSAETRERVLTAISELGYVANAAARNLAQGKTGNIGLLLPNASTDFMSSLMQVVATTAAEQNYDLLVAVRSESSTRRMLGRHNSDGVLIFGHYVREADVRQIAAEGCPALMLYQAPPGGLPLPSILIENTSGARDIVRHLITAHARRRIAFLRGARESQDSKEREEGYRQALAEHGLCADPRLIRGGFGAEEARASTLEWIRDGAPIDAVFAWCDNAAAGVIDALRSAGRAVPGEVSVVGFDDVPSARLLEPPLTTLRAPTARIGRAAVEQLVQLIQTGTAAPTTRLPVELVIRRSCGCAP